MPNTQNVENFANEKKNQVRDFANEKKDEVKDASKSMIDRAVAEIRSIDADDIKRSAAEITTKVRDFSTESYDETIRYVRANPIKVGLGLAAVGFVLGSLSGIMKKSA